MNVIRQSMVLKNPAETPTTLLGVSWLDEIRIPPYRLVASYYN